MGLEGSCREGSLQDHVGHDTLAGGRAWFGDHGGFHHAGVKVICAPPPRKHVKATDENHVLLAIQNLEAAVGQQAAEVSGLKKPLSVKAALSRAARPQ